MMADVVTEPPSQPKPRRPWLLTVALVLVCAAAGFSLPIGLVYWWVNSTYFDNRDFDQDVWIAHRNSWASDNPRGEMAYDLRDRLLRQRPTHPEVVSLLGEPDWPDQDPPHRIAYILGAWSGFRIDHDSLDIVFDAEGRVERVLIVNH